MAPASDGAPGLRRGAAFGRGMGEDGAIAPLRRRAFPLVSRGDASLRALLEIWQPGAALPPRLPARLIMLLGDAPWPIRDQGDRPTCIAHAAAAVLEHPRHIAGEVAPDVSEQFLYWAMQRSRTALKEPGRDKFRHLAEALRDAGYCGERQCGYSGAARMPVDDPGPAPDPAVIARAAAHKYTGPLFYDDLSTPCPPGPAARILGLLAAGHAVGVALELWRDRAWPPGVTNWTLPEALFEGDRGNRPQVSGIVPDPGRPDRGEAPLEGAGALGHAVCIIGFIPDARERRGGYFLARNSWGSRGFAADPASCTLPGLRPHLRRGHAVISAFYVDQYSRELFALADPDDCANRPDNRLAVDGGA